MGTFRVRIAIADAGGSRFQELDAIVDTGATYTIISLETAISIGYNPIASKKHIEVTTASGTIIAPIITIKSITCLGYKVANIDVICHDLPPQSPVKGLLGLNFLIHFPPFKKFLNEVNKMQL